MEARGEGLPYRGNAEREREKCCESFHSPRQGPAPLPALQHHPNVPLVLIKWLSRGDVNGHISGTYRVVIAGAVVQAGIADIYGGVPWWFKQYLGLGAITLL